MRTSGFIIALGTLVCAIPLSAQKLVVDSLVAVRPFGHPDRYSWPVIRMPGKYAVARRINEDLHMWGEHFIDPDTAGVHFFDEVWGIPPYASGVMMGSPEWEWARPMEELLVVTVTAEWCGAYCEGSTEHYHYDLRDGSRVRFDSLFTSEGLRQVKQRVGERWRQIVVDHLTALRDTSERSSAELDGDGSMDAIDLYERCLGERPVTDPYVSDMLIGPGGITTWLARCSAHIELASDDLMEVPVPLSVTELIPLMRPSALRWLRW